MTKFAVAILMLALTTPASGQEANSANFYLPGCKGSLGPQGTPLWGQGLCYGFIAGLGYMAIGKDFCSPDGVTSQQAVAVVIKYIEARPERTHEPFGVLALEALTAAWPCKR
jgi:hypothetical protein